MESADINWAAVVVAALVPIVLGALWYSPVLFSATWMRAVGKTPEELTGARTGYAIAAAGALVASYVLAWVVDWADATSLLGGGGVGLIAWIGFVATSMAVNTWFAGRPLELYVIDGGYHLVSYVLMGAILAVWD